MAHACCMKPYNRIYSYLLAVRYTNLIQCLGLMTCPEKNAHSSSLRSCQTARQSEARHRMHTKFTNSATRRQSWNLTLPTLPATARKVTKIEPKALKRADFEPKWHPQNGSYRRETGPEWVHFDPSQSGQLDPLGRPEISLKSGQKWPFSDPSQIHHTVGEVHFFERNRWTPPPKPIRK